MTAEPTSGISLLETTTMRRVATRLVPFLMICYFFALLDRVNVGFAALQMNEDIGLSPAVFGLGASLFFVSYFLFEVPSNLALQRYGARRWIARIMITWGLISAGMSCVVGPWSFYAMRFLLGAAEAGFFPGVVLYLTYWFPSAYRARIVAIFMVSIPVASFVGSPLSALLLEMDGVLGLAGWQWLFVLEGLPSALLGAVCLLTLSDRPAEARWLTPEQKGWLVGRIEAESTHQKRIGKLSFWQLIRNRYFLTMALVCSGASAAGSSLSIWQPQILKSYGLSSLQIGFVNAIPYGIASIVMILWGRHSDRTGERRWHTAYPLMMIAVGLASTALTGTLTTTMVMLCLALIGTYSFKGPFWALTSSWMSPATAAAGLAGINASANLIGGGMISLVGYIKGETGSYPLALLPVVVLAGVACLSVLLIGRTPGPIDSRERSVLNTQESR